MDGEVQPKFGLMVSLILMNLTAITLFFFATPTSREISKKRIDNAENVPIRQADIVVSADALIEMGDEDFPVFKPSEAKKRSSEDDDLSMMKIGKEDLKRFSLGEVRTLPGKVEMRIFDIMLDKKANNSEHSGRPTEPPLAAALKNFVGNTNAGIRKIFEGLKNGYTMKRVRESTENRIIVSMKKSNITEVASGSTRTVPKTADLKTSPIICSKTNSPSNNKETLYVPFSAHKLQKSTPTLGPAEDGNSFSNEAIPTDIVMDALCRAQKRTNELMYVFSKKVVPAIERMNDRVAEAIRLEKNLDSYTSALINAINSVFCPGADIETKLNEKQSRSRKNAVRKLRNANPFCSELSLLRDSRIRDYVGSNSNGEKSSLNKRPVFKTLAARCWHTRHRRMNRKRKLCSKPEELKRPEDSESSRLKQEHDNVEHETTQDVSGHTHHCGTKSNQECVFRENHVNVSEVTKNVNTGPLKSVKVPYERTIGIEEVLALTSSLEQCSEQRINSEKEIPFQSPLNSDISMSSGMACRSCVIDPHSIEPHRVENESSERPLNLEPSESPPGAEPESEGLIGLGQSKPLEDTLCPEFAIVCDSRIQTYESFAQKEISTVAACPFDDNETQTVSSFQTVPSHSGGTHQLGGSNHSSFSSKVKMMGLVNVFQQLSLKQKEVAIESVCLLVLRIFEAWAESQGSVSSLGLSKISLNAWPSTDELSSHCSRPHTAICRSGIDSGQEQESRKENSVPIDDTKKYKSAPDFIIDSVQTNTEISQTLMQNVVEAAEVQIAERSLIGLRANILRNIPSKGDIPTRKSWLDSADVTNQTGFGDIKEPINVDHELAVSLMSTSRESVKVSKESSAATFYTGQRESSEDAFYECASTMSTGTCGSNELELKDSSTLFLERIQEEETRLCQNENLKVAKHAVVVEPRAPGSSLSVESWLTDSGDELITAKETLNSEESPATEDSSCHVACGTDDEAYPCSSQDLSGDEFKAEMNKKDRSKKKKWASKMFNKFLRKKSKPSSFPSVALTKNTSRSQSDSVLKPVEQNPLLTDGGAAQ